MSLLTLPKFDLKNPEKLFIGEAWVEPSSSEMIDVVNPATGEVTIRVAAVQPADIITALPEAFDNGRWSRMAPQERTVCRRKFATAPRAQSERLGQGGVEGLLPYFDTKTMPLDALLASLR
jgi:acyl-CoA reductase-like NAD-dependent aldehyde dehydrogenase